MNAQKCEIDWCDLPCEGRFQYCRNHRRRERKYGDPLGGRFQFPTGTSLPDRLAWKSSPGPGGCLLWHGGVGNSGGRYGVVTRPEGGQVSTHVAAWEIASERKVPKGMVVRHTCDVPLCINPEHLILGTQGDNLSDMHERGRGVYGERVHGSKLTAADIPKIRARLADGEFISGVAREYGVWPTTIHDIATGKTWSRVQ